MITLKKIGKLLYLPSILWGVASLVFVIFSLKPGDPSRMLGGQFTDEATLASIRKDLGLDLSASHRYLLYLNNVSPLSVHPIHSDSPFAYKTHDFSGYKLRMGSVYFAVKWPYLGKSYQSKRLVNEIIQEAFPGTLVLALCSIALALIVALVFGVASAIHHNTWFDKITLSLSAIGMSGPSFFTGILVAWLFAFLWYQQINISVYWFVFLGVLLGLRFLLKVTLNISHVLGLACIFILLHSFLPWVVHWPGTGLNLSGSLYDVHPFNGEVLVIKNLVLPVVTLAIRPLGVFIPLIRNAVLDEMSKPYIKTFKSWGYGPYFLHFKQALPNALNPIATTVSGWFASLLAGAVFVEYIFSWRGLGLVMYEALERDDIPVVMGLVLLFASIFVIINALVNKSYKYLDPRLR